MTVTLNSAAAVQPLVRIRRAPPLDPPADNDRRTDDHPVCAGQLALFASVHNLRPAGTGPASARRAAGPAPAADPRPAYESGPATGGPPAPMTGTTAPPAAIPAGAAASRFVAACVEVLNGFRPVGHLRALTTALDFAAVSAQLTRRAVRVRMCGRDRTGKERVRVRRTRVFEQHGGAAEAVAVLDHGGTSWAIALRFEQQHGGWLCTLLEVV
jgi:hypothetical protein